MIKKTLTSAGNFVSKHRVIIAVAATTAVCVVAQRQIVKGWNEFLTEHDLFEKYYSDNES